MAVIPAAVTDLARQNWPQMIGGILTLQTISYFKIAEGGWIDPGGGKEPRDPFAHVAETDVDANANPGRYPADSLFVFQKSFGAGDIIFVSPTKIRCEIFLDFGEANDDGNGNDPEFWEVGIFDTNDDMVAYGTFPQQTKNSGLQIQDFISIVF